MSSPESSENDRRCKDGKKKRLKRVKSEKRKHHSRYSDRSEDDEYRRKWKERDQAELASNPEFREFDGVDVKRDKMPRANITMHEKQQESTMILFCVVKHWSPAGAFSSIWKRLTYPWRMLFKGTCNWIKEDFSLCTCYALFDSITSLALKTHFMSFFITHCVDKFWFSVRILVRNTQASPCHCYEDLLGKNFSAKIWTCQYYYYCNYYWCHYSLVLFSLQDILTAAYCWAVCLV